MELRVSVCRRRPQLRPLIIDRIGLDPPLTWSRSGRRQALLRHLDGGCPATVLDSRRT